jgi:TPR repeat protein
MFAKQAKIVLHRHSLHFLRRPCLAILLFLAILCRVPPVRGSEKGLPRLQFGQVLRWLGKVHTPAQTKIPTIKTFSFFQESQWPNSNPHGVRTVRNYNYRLWAYKKGAISVALVMLSRGIPIYWESDGKATIALTISPKHPTDLLVARNVEFGGNGFLSERKSHPWPGNFRIAFSLRYKRVDFSIRRLRGFLREGLSAASWFRFESEPKASLDLFQPHLLGGTIVSAVFKPGVSAAAPSISTVKLYASRHGELMLRPVLATTRIRTGRSVRPLAIADFRTPRIPGFQIRGNGPADVILAAISALLPPHSADRDIKPASGYQAAVKRLCRWAVGHPLRPTRTRREQRAIWLQQLAAAGNVEAMYTLGVLYAKGHEVKHDYHQAMFWLRRAAAAGSSRAVYGVAMLYEKGWGVKQSHKRAIKWFKRAAKEGVPAALYEVGSYYANGLGVARNYSKAMILWRKAAAAGNAMAMYGIGSLYGNGAGVKRSKRKALVWLRKAAVAGNAFAMYRLGLFFFYGHGVARDYKSAFKWWKKAADAGYPDAVYGLGYLYAGGRGVAQDYRRAIKLWKRAAGLGSASAMTGLGGAYHRGKGVTKSNQKAEYWYKKAADAGDITAKNWLAKHSQ